MDSLFGRKKSRPRQSSVSLQDLNERSVPYDKLSAPSRSPIAVGTINQGLKGISAPSTNPALTTSGTELNRFTMQRSKLERDTLYERHLRQDSPSESISTGDSLTLYSDPNEASSSRVLSPHSQSTQLHRSEASTSSSRSENMPDFGQYSVSPLYNSFATVRPMSAVSSRSDINRNSKYTPSLASPDGGPHHSHLSQFYHRNHLSESFQFPRPETDEEIELLFENVKRTRDLAVLPNLSVDQKWHMVYNDMQIRWREEKQREEQSRKQNEAGQPGAIMTESPEWYIKRFLDKTITAKQAGGLLVSLRSREVSWFQHFISIQGTSVLAQTLQHISRKGSSRQETDINLEYEIVKCLRTILNNKDAANEALTHPSIVTQITSSLTSPHLPTRKSLLDLLCFLTYWNDGEAHGLVLAALEALSTSHNEGGGCYDSWFKSLEHSLSGRGMMGSLVGASEEIKRTGGIDSSLNEYAFTNLLLINGILSIMDDFDLRFHHRSQMESAGLQKIIELCMHFGVPSIDIQIKRIQSLFAEDEEILRQRLDQGILQDLTNPQDVFNAIYAKTDGTRARNYFLSMMQHLLLIREDGQSLVHYYRLLDSIVTDVVLDNKLGGAEQRMGRSVDRIIAQFNDADRYQAMEDEANKARALAVQLKLEKEALEDEISQGHDGLVGNLKVHIASLEEKLSVSRETTSRLHSQIADQRTSYEQKIAQLEAQIMELFRMLKEVGKDVETILDGGGMDRKSLVQTLERKFQRHRTISILEGKEFPNGRQQQKDVDAVNALDDDDEDTEATPRKFSLRKSKITGSVGKRGHKGHSDSKIVIVDDSGRVSQFMDADEADALEQVQQQLAAGAKLYSPHIGSISGSRSIRGSPRRTERAQFNDTFKPGYLLAPKPDDTISNDSADLSRSSSPGNDLENEYHRSTRGVLVDRSMSTSLSSRVPVSGSLAEQLNKQILLRRKSLSNRDGSSRGMLLSIPSPPPPPLPPPSNSTLSSVDGSARTAMLGLHLSAFIGARKEMPITPGTKMKQLQWDKLPQQQVSKTLWQDDESQKEQEMLQKLQVDGVWMEMEENFKAKQLVIKLMGKLSSVLDMETKKKVEILIQLVKRLEPEEIAHKLQQFDPGMCTQAFLSELKRVLPSPEEVGKLNVYRNAEPSELAELHPSDRLMVQLIKIDRLGPRIEGMLYKLSFDDSWALLDEGARKLSEAGRSLLGAKRFKQLLSLILLIGNYMNGTGIKGGAFGFRVSSINKLVDTKSVNNTTLLNFLERTVAKHFPEMEEFMEELEKPAEAYRVNLQDIRKDLSDLQHGLVRIRQELVEHFTDLDDKDRYGKQMWAFYNKANVQLEDLVDDVRHADTTLVDAIKYYGEEDKNMSSSEFYGIFKTFVTSYKKCKLQNQTIAEEKSALERRRQAHEESRSNRQKEREAADEDGGALEKLLTDLRNGDTISRKARRRRPAPNGHLLSALPLNLDSPTSSNDTSHIARDMLARLQSDGFVATPPSVAVQHRRRRRRTEQNFDSEEMSGSPLAIEIQGSNEGSASETQDLPPGTP
ncbi:hypothetical protein BYT27DRAFT_7225940 [Phlegmacium glaucopus]|nr:hypothetical protein BYT27DRAFT_7225940 [Phlegmacium glaucopus]